MDHDGVRHHLDDSLVEQIWQDLDGQVTRELICQVVNEIATEFRTATITAFIPIFIRRQAREKLEILVNDNKGSVTKHEPIDQERFL